MHPITEKPKEDPITGKPKEDTFNEGPQRLQDLQWVLHRKRLFKNFLVMVYDKVGDKFRG